MRRCSFTSSCLSVVFDMLLAITYLLPGEVGTITSTSPGFLNGIWWSYDPIVIDFHSEQYTAHQCPSDSVEVSGDMLDDGGSPGWKPVSVEYLQKTTCTSWIEKNFPERCASFDKEAWLQLSTTFPRKNMSFCMDRYEWPNVKGTTPWVMVTYPEAQGLCESVGKRLCTEDEWTFACEGEEGLPYPWGYERRSEECGTDKRWKKYSSSALADRGSQKCSKELERLWQGDPSGSRPTCASPFGVEDMSGNVDEWASRTRQGKYVSILKGGYWGPVRTRCRPSTRNHGPGHTFYQQGFRCCSDL